MHDVASEPERVVISTEVELVYASPFSIVMVDAVGSV